MRSLVRSRWPRGTAGLRESGKRRRIRQRNLWSVDSLPDRSSHVTELLSSLRDGREEATARLWEVVYDELHELARGKMARESDHHTLQPTALVHEAFLRLVRSDQRNWQNRAHFFGAAAEAMRRILIDRARKYRTAKRQGANQALSLEEIDVVAAEHSLELLSLSDSLDVLEKSDPRKTTIVKLRFFAGLTIDETAKVLGCSPATVTNEWRFARAWLQRDMGRFVRAEEP